MTRRPARQRILPYRAFLPAVFLAICLSVGLIAACNRAPVRENGILVPAPGPFPERLSQWGLFQAPSGRDLVPLHNVTPYDLNTPLFTDYADKFRTIWMPAGSPASYREWGSLDFPEGTIISKTFSFAGRRIETRLLFRTSEGWNALPYLWNDDQSDAELALAGATVSVTSPKTGRFEYFVPNATQCRGCHIVFLKNKDITPLGAQARHMNRDNTYDGQRRNQLEHLARIGFLTGLPAGAPESVPRTPVWNDPATGSLEARALSYLDVNCSHCHNPEGPARTSGLTLGLDDWSSARIYGRNLALVPAISDGAKRPLARGFCKPPVAAGRGSGHLQFDIVPGRPEKSILPFRLESTDLGVMMPEAGRTLVHREGVTLLTSWIKSMPGGCDDR